VDRPFYTDPSTVAPKARRWIVPSYLKEQANYPPLHCALRRDKLNTLQTVVLFLGSTRVDREAAKRGSTRFAGLSGAIATER
jgi:hypothetical protein